MKRILLFFLLIISIFSFAAEKSSEQIMDEFREKIAKKEEEKLKKEEEVQKEKETLKVTEKVEDSKQKLEDDKRAMKLIEKKRREIMEQPLEEKFARAENKGETYEKALEIGESRMSFVEVKNSEDPYLKAYKANISKKYNEIKEEKEKILAERAKIEKQLKDLDELEQKVINW
jgi:hypothetical protein